VEQPQRASKAILALMEQPVHKVIQVLQGPQVCRVLPALLSQAQQALLAHKDNQVSTVLQAHKDNLALMELLGHQVLLESMVQPVQQEFRELLESVPLAQLVPPELMERVALLVQQAFKEPVELATQGPPELRVC